MLKHYVEFCFAGTFFIERQIKEVDERNPNLITVPSDAFAYRFYDCTETVINGETLIGEKKNFSPFTYFGKLYTLNEVKSEFPENKNLISNMEYNKIDKVVRTRKGNWQFLKKGDIVIT